MEQLFNYGEFLICFGPVFLIIALVFGGLIWNSLPPGPPDGGGKDEK